jgi:hypothetical protein
MTLGSTITVVTQQDIPEPYRGKKVLLSIQEKCKNRNRINEGWMTIGVCGAKQITNNVNRSKGYSFIF